MEINITKPLLVLLLLTLNLLLKPSTKTKELRRPIRDECLRRERDENNVTSPMLGSREWAAIAQYRGATRGDDSRGERSGERRDTCEQNQENYLGLKVLYIYSY